MLLTLLKIVEIKRKGCFYVEKKNIYFKFLIGANEQSTGVIENATDTH